MANETNIDVGNYRRHKQDNMVRIIKVNGVVHYALRRFDPETGKPVPLLITLNREQIETQKAALTESLAALDAMLVDIDSAQEV
jgi:hypothetical protein